MKNINKIISFVLILILSFTTISCVNLNVKTASSDISKLLNEKTTQYFLDEEVPDDVVKNIINAGINAESGMNNQKWHFSAVKKKLLLAEWKEKLSANMPEAMKNQAFPKAQLGDSPLAIVVSCTENEELNAGFATEAMLAYAMLSGYGTKLVSSPCSMINESYKEELGIPGDMNSVVVLLIGKPLDVSKLDGVTSASVRKTFDEVATVVK